MGLHALVIGVSYKGHDQINELKYASEDAEQIHDFLQDSGYRSRLLYDSKTNYACIRDAFKEARARLKSGDTFVFYFSGHGYETGSNQYLLPHDADPWSIKYGGGSAIPLKFIEKATDVDGVERIIIIDACRKSLRRDKSPFDDSGGITKKAINDVVSCASKESSLGILCSCKTGLPSSEFEKLKGSVFTTALLDVFNKKKQNGEEISLPHILESVQKKVGELQEKYSSLPVRQVPHYNGECIVLLQKERRQLAHYKAAPSAKNMSDSAKPKPVELSENQIPSFKITSQEPESIPYYSFRNNLLPDIEPKKTVRKIFDKLPRPDGMDGVIQSIPSASLASDIFIPSGTDSGGGYDNTTQDGVDYPKLASVVPRNDDISHLFDHLPQASTSIDQVLEQKRAKKRADNLLEVILLEHSTWLESKQELGSDRLSWRKLEPVLEIYRDAHLGGLNLSGRNLQKADFSNAIIPAGTSFKGANLSFSVFQHAQLTEIDFSECSMEHSDLLGIIVYQCNFTDAYLDSSKWLMSSLATVNFSKASLKHCDFTAADFNRCNFSNACLDFSTFCLANLSEVDLNGCSIDECDINEANINFL